MATEPWEWEEEDLELLISTGRQEAIDLDYKSNDALGKSEGKKNEISKDVSAFANSAGGVIVYGMKEDGHVPTELDDGYDPADISKEWLEQVINSRIQQRIDGVRVKQVALRKTRPGRLAYVVCVPQSARAPHQASDKRFYKRFNFESQPMEEYEVRDVANRLVGPDLRITLRIESANHHQDGARLLARCVLRAFIGNDSPVPAEYAVIYLYFDPRLDVPAGATPHGFTRSEQATVETATGPRRILALHRNWTPMNNMPVFEHQDFDVAPPGLTIDAPSDGEPTDYLIGWEVRAPRMAVRRDFTVLRVAVGYTPALTTALAT